MSKTLKFMGIFLLSLTVMPLDVMADETFSGMQLTQENVNDVIENTENETQEEIPSSEEEVEEDIVSEEEVNEEQSNEELSSEEEKVVVPQEENIQEPKQEDVTVSGQMHVQNMGWMNNNGNIFGTNGKGLRVEAIKVNVSHPTITGGIKYQSHVQNQGWQRSVSNGELSGSQGKSLRLEAFRAELTGDLANYYDVYYRTHVQNLGWLEWAKNGDKAGTESYGLRLEAIEIKVLPKNSTEIQTGVNSFKAAVKTRGQAQIQYRGWTNAVDEYGTTGKGLRLEALKMNLDSPVLSGGIEYRVHVQNRGWFNYVKDGQMAGTSGQSLRLEAVELRLTGEVAKYYDIFYNAHVQNMGWLGWTSNGKSAGTEGYGYRVESIKVAVIPKGSGIHYNNPGAFKKWTNKQYIPKYYAQGDPRWGHRYYGMGNMASTGCVPTAIAMTLSGIVGRDVSPVELADYLYLHTSEFNRINIGASGLAFKLGVERFGVPTRGLNNTTDLTNALKSGNMVLAMVGANSPFINGGTHAIVLYGYNSDGTTNVLDPNNARKNGRYRVSDIYNWRSGDPYDWRGGYVFYSVGDNKF